MQQKEIKNKDAVLLKFMERTIENINTCLAGQYTLYRLLIDKKLITEPELIDKLKEDKSLPVRKKGMKVLKDMLSPNWEDIVDFEKTQQAILDDIKQRIKELVLPEHWEKEEKVIPPNIQAKKLAYQACSILYKDNGFQPSIIACIKENGVFLKFVNKTKSLIIEVYNDGEVGLLINEDKAKKIIYSGAIPVSNFEYTLMSCVKVFFSYT